MHGLWKDCHINQICELPRLRALYEEAGSGTGARSILLSHCCNN